MKKLLPVMFVAVLMVGCGPNNEEQTATRIRFAKESDTTGLVLHAKQITGVTPQAKLTDLTTPGLGHNQISDDQKAMLPLKDLFVMMLMSIIIIVGVYQFYFLTQNHMLKPARRFSTRFDEKIPFQPGWVWIYSGLYYPMIVAIILTMDDMRHYNLTVMSFIFLLLMQMICFRYYPVETPPKWREFGDRTGFNIAFMRLVQKYDDNTNCFPSMHVSVATLTALHMMGNEPWLGPWPLVLPLLIAISALFTKQHYFVDLIPGAVLGWIAWQIHLWFIG